MVDCTLVIAADATHRAEYQLSSETWLAKCPAVLDMPMVVLADDDVYESARTNWMFARNVRVYRVTSPKDWPQRERMLASFCLQAPHLIGTKYFLKLDTDAIKVDDSPFPLDEWFEGDPVLVSSPWGYSKPSNAMQVLDDWGDTIPDIAKHPRLNIPFDPSWSRVCHPRIISYVYFGLTEWHRKVATYLGGRLPLASQDTVHFYIAERTKAFYRRVKMKRHGWQHIGRGGDKLKRAVQEVLSASH